MKYRKKPVVIEAVQLRWDNWMEMCKHANVGPHQGQPRGVPRDDGKIAMEIPTLEGTLQAIEGDWIIRGIKGELYSCRDDIFRLTYEPVEEPPK